VDGVWWHEEAGLREEAPPLAGAREADVAIVGGGYCGLWTALTLKERDPGLDVVVLEAAFCGEGPSGRNGGFLHGYWSSLPSLREALGDEGALAVARASSRIVPAVRAFCETRGEDVWLREGGLLKVSASLAQDAALEPSAVAAAELGVPEEAVPLSAEQVAERCRSPVFRRGVFFRDGATVQPARLARALRRAALDAGVAVHERTRVTRVQPGDPNLLETPGGTVRSREVVLAVSAAAAGWPPLRSRLTNFGSYVVLTEPVPEPLEEIGWTRGEAIVDGRTFLHYFRTTSDGRVLMGSGTGPIGFGGRIDARFFADTASMGRAERGLRRLLPALAGARITHAWGGPIDVSADRFPFIGTVPDRRVRYAAGFSGNGVGPAWLAGQVLASLASGRDDEWTALPLVERRPPRRLPPEPLKRLGGGVVRAAALAVEEAEEEGRRPSALARAVASAPRLLGIRLGTR
jgi:glycine/D-amino acid oxidase-like deaminating enzyme